MNKVALRFELRMEALQASALPLGYATEREPLCGKRFKPVNGLFYPRGEFLLESIKIPILTISIFGDGKDYLFKLTLEFSLI